MNYKILNGLICLFLISGCTQTTTSSQSKSDSNCHKGKILKNAGQTAFHQIFRPLLGKGISLLKPFNHFIVPPLQLSIEQKFDSPATCG